MLVSIALSLQFRQTRPKLSLRVVGASFHTAVFHLGQDGRLYDVFGLRSDVRHTPNTRRIRRKQWRMNSSSLEDRDRPIG